MPYKSTRNKCEYLAPTKFESLDITNVKVELQITPMPDQRLLM